MVKIICRGYGWDENSAVQKASQLRAATHSVMWLY